MAEYLVKVADERGTVFERSEAGSSQSEVRDRFAQQGYHVFFVKERGLLGGAESPIGRRRVKLEDFVLFNQQFVTLIRAGLPILTSLELLQKRQRSVALQGIIGNVRDRVRNGEALSDAFAAQRSKAITKIYTTSLMAGEKSGNLEEVLTRFIGFQRVALSFRKKLVSSLVYPALLILAIITMFTFLITYVVPQFGELYSSLHVPLPASTSFLLSMGRGARVWVPVTFGVIVLTVLLVLRWRNTQSGAAQIDRMRLAIPVFGGIY
ncbi:MAG: type II secretion system F family protein, partial [Acidobacteriales bacterium]|nr:type II secretion system F family protein [Terriglobales bacterium]